MAQVSNTTKNTTLELTGKFGELAKFLFGGSSNVKKDIFFNGKAKIVKEKGTASKLKPLKQGNDMLDMLMKIYNFLNKNFEEDKLHREVQNNFKEEQLREDKKRHEALLTAIEKLMKSEEKDKPTAEKESDGGFSILDTLLDALNLGKDALLLLRVLGPLLINPLTITLLAAAAAGTVGAWIWSQIQADPKAALEGKGGIGMAVAGLGSEGQLPSVENELSDKQLKKMAEQVDKKGIKNASIPELEAKKKLLVDYGKEKSPEVAEIDKEIEDRKTATVSTVPPASTEAPAQNVTTPQSNKLNEVTKQNNDMKVESMVSPAPSKTTNTVNASVGKTERPVVPRIKIPPVRNQEPTFQSMIIYSTRVV